MKVNVNINDLIQSTSSLAFLGLEQGAQLRHLQIHIWLALLSELGTGTFLPFESLFDIKWSALQFFISGTRSGWERVKVKLLLSDTSVRLVSTVDCKRSSNRNAAFLLLIAGILNNVFEDIDNYSDVLQLLLEVNAPVGSLKLGIKETCLAKRVFMKNIEATKLLLSAAVQDVTGHSKDYHIVEGPSTQRGLLKPFYPWEAKELIFNSMDIDACLSSPPSQEVFISLLQFYGYEHGLHTFYPNEEPNGGLRCPFCGKEQTGKQSKKRYVEHAHSCAKAQAVSVDANFLPWPPTCTYMLDNRTPNSLDYRCNKRLLWASTEEKHKTINHLASHRTSHGNVCRWDACGIRTEGKADTNTYCVSLQHLAIHIESTHLNSLRERDALYCFLCSYWLPQGPEAELHILAHLPEIRYSIQEVGFKGITCSYNAGRILKPWFCPFCYISRELVPSTQYKQYGEARPFLVHVRKVHINALTNTKSHKCPVHCAKHCDDESLMTPSELSLHLAAHDIFI